MESKWNRAKMKLAENLEIPNDVILSTPKITISSNNEISIENHKGIIAFERELGCFLSSRAGIFK